MLIFNIKLFNFDIQNIYVMKQVYLSLLLILSCSHMMWAQEDEFVANQYDVQNYYKEIRNQNASKLMMKNNQTYGFIGADYWRLYIHFTDVKQNPKNPYEYFVKGKSKTKGNICSFTGTITITEAITFLPEELQYLKDKSKEEIEREADLFLKGLSRQGEFKANVVLKEDKNQKGSGAFRGILRKGFLIAHDMIEDDEPIYYGDVSDAGLYFEGNWSSYKTGAKKRCYWISGSTYRTQEQDLFRNGDDGDLYINKKYLKNGWENYETAFHAPYETNQSIMEAAWDKEYEEWWK